MPEDENNVIPELQRERLLDKNGNPIPEAIVNEPLLEYVRRMASIIRPNEKDAGFLLLIFIMRYFGHNIMGRIVIPEEMRDHYLDERDTHCFPNLLSGYELDKDKFWYMLLFIKDYVEDIYEDTSFLTSKLDDLIDRISNLQGNEELKFKNNDGKWGVTIKDKDEMKRLAAYIILGREEFYRKYPEAKYHDNDESIARGKKANKTRMAKIFWRCMNLFLTDYKNYKSPNEGAFASMLFYLCGLTDDERYNTYLRVYNGKYGPNRAILDIKAGQESPVTKQFKNRYYIRAGGVLPTQPRF